MENKNPIETKHFDELFKLENNMLQAIFPIRIEGEELLSGETSFANATSINGIDLTPYMGKEHQVKVVDGYYEIQAP
jgi:hypothetical protein